VEKLNRSISKLPAAVSVRRGGLRLSSPFLG
jgi:hypothetical protein